MSKIGTFQRFFANHLCVDDFLVKKFHCVITFRFCCSFCGRCLFVVVVVLCVRCLLVGLVFFECCCVSLIVICGCFCVSLTLCLDSGIEFFFCLFASRLCSLFHTLEFCVCFNDCGIVICICGYVEFLVLILILSIFGLYFFSVCI